MPEELDLIKEVAKRLDKAGIKYMLTGSMALSVYSTPRMTRDIDIIIKISASDVGKIVDLFRGDFYIDEPSVRQAVERRGMFNIIEHRSVIKVDFIVKKEGDFRDMEFSRRKQIDVEGTPVSIVAPEDLILSKLVWAKDSKSDLQLRDVREMLAEQTNLDKDYLDQWSEELGVKGLLEDTRKNER